jgi:beta-N-acetylhexosaminidase
VRPFPIWITMDADATPAQMESYLRDANPWGVILFARHLKSPAQVKELNALIHGAIPGWAPRIALDQEGGRVNRLAALGMTYPSASDGAGEPGQAEAVAFEMGCHLRNLGFDVDFAPVADLGPAAAGTGLEGRVYGDAPDTVTACCAAFLRGLERAGVEGCLKHFPGLGGSVVDSHVGLPEIGGDDVARRPHLEPYLALGGSVPYVMVAHGEYLSLGSPVPSSLHHRTYELLAQAGFLGLSVTDDLGMGAVSRLMPLADLAEACLAAGASLALWVASQDSTLRAMDSLIHRPAFLARRDALPYR